MFEEQLLQGSCHCGAVRLTLPSAPEKATKCNCSLCRRLGGLWAYFEFGTVQIQGHPENTASYIWGDKMISLHHCPAYSNIFDCGFSPVVCETEIFCSGVADIISRRSRFSMLSVRR